MDARHNRRKHSLLLLSTFFLAAMILLVAERWHSAREDVAEDMLALAKIVGTNASAAVIFNDSQAAEEILAALEHSPNLIEAKLYRKDGKLLAAFLKRGFAAMERPLAPMAEGHSVAYSVREVHLASPIVSHDEVVGTVMIRASQDELYESLARFLAGYVAITAFAILLAMAATRKLRRRMAATENLFDSFFNSSQIGMAMIDRELRFLRINDALAKNDGLPAEGHVGRAVSAVLPGLADAIEGCHREVLETGTKLDMEIRGNASGQAGDERYWLTSYFPLRDNDGEIFACGAVVLDITERKNAELGRRESERRLRSVTDHLPVALFQITCHKDNDARFAYVSEGAAPLLGIAPDRLVADFRAFRDAIHPDDAALFESLWRKQEPPSTGEPSVTWTGRFRNPRAGEVWIELRGSLTTDESGLRIMNGVLLDVSQLKRYQADLEQSGMRLQQLTSHRENLVNAEHKRIAAEIHDELGQILTLALLDLRLLGRDIPPSNKGAKDLIEDIDRLLNEAYRNMKDIAASLRPAALNFGIATAIEWLAERLLKKAGIEWHIDIGEPAPQLDERQSVTLFRIIQESLTNCVRHADARSIHIALAVRDGSIELVISDDGKGFGTADDGTKMQFGILGIRERAESLGGSASISSQPGQGVAIRVTVPHAATVGGPK